MPMRHLNREPCATAIINANTDMRMPTESCALIRSLLKRLVFFTMTR